MDIRLTRSWMYNRLIPGRKGYTAAFEEGVEEFISFACKQESVSNNQIRCPCPLCKNIHHLDAGLVKVHLYRKGFKPDYWYWTCHGESDPELQTKVNARQRTTATSQKGRNEYSSRLERVVSDAVGQEYQMDHDKEMDESPNIDDQEFYDLLHAARKPSSLQNCGSITTSQHRADMESFTHTWEELTQAASLQGATPSSQFDVWRDAVGANKGTMHGRGLYSTIVLRPYNYGSSSSSSKWVHRQELNELRHQMEEVRTERDELRVEIESTKKICEQNNKMIKQLMNMMKFQQPPFNEEMDDEDDEESDLEGQSGEES